MTPKDVNWDHKTADTIESYFILMLPKKAQMTKSSVCSRSFVQHWLEEAITSLAFFD